MSTQGAEPMGEAPREIQITALLNQARERFPESQRSALHIQDGAEVVAILPVHATIQAIVALVQNALDANVYDRPVILGFHRIGPSVSISIQDEGSGMEEDVVRRIAEPSLRLKNRAKAWDWGRFWSGFWRRGWVAASLLPQSPAAARRPASNCRLRPRR